GGIHRVAVAGLAARLALGQPHRLPAGDIHGREEGELGGCVEFGHGQQIVRAVGRQSESSQFLSSRMPAAPDFSGWNWVADRGPFSAAATNRSPCSDHVTRGGANAPWASSVQLVAA